MLRLFAFALASAFLLSSAPASAKPKVLVVKKSSQKKHDVEVASKTKGPKKDGPKKSAATLKKKSQHKADLAPASQY